MSVHSYTVRTIDGADVSLSQYQGKVLLIVNTASRCGFTPQYEGLEALYRRYKDQGFVVLGFPCNQFAGQEPGDAEEIKTFCSVNYNVTFPLFDKVNVRGEDAHPLFHYLTAKKPFRGFDPAHPITDKLNEVLKQEFPEYLGDDSIKWNFTKFLINREGGVIARFEPTTTPEALTEAVEKAL